MNMRELDITLGHSPMLALSGCIFYGVPHNPVKQLECMSTSLVLSWGELITNQNNKRDRYSCLNLGQWNGFLRQCGPLQIFPKQWVIAAKQMVVVCGIWASKVGQGTQVNDNLKLREACPYEKRTLYYDAILLGTR